MKVIDSTFAILDVKKGRGALERRVMRGERIHVILLGTLVSPPHSRDDGESIEFQVDVEHVMELAERADASP